MLSIVVSSNAATVLGGLGRFFRAKVAKSGAKTPTEKTVKKRSWGKRGKNQCQDGPPNIDGSYFGSRCPLGGRGVTTKTTHKKNARYLNTPLGQRPGEFMKIGQKRSEFYGEFDGDVRFALKHQQTR